MVALLTGWCAGTEKGYQMCQLLGMSASEPLNLRFSWKKFAMRGSEFSGNPDGWGVAYLDGTDAQLIREPAPAADSPHVAFLESHGPASDMILSHVRRATVGDRRLANTQPFVRRLGGRVHVFAHNGHVSLPALNNHSPWLVPVGETDSEDLFCRLLHDIEVLWRGSEPPSLDARTEVVADFARSMSRLGALNFLYSDGLTLFAHSHRRTVPGDEISTDPGLFLLHRDRVAESGEPGLCEGLRSGGECGSATLIATVPLDSQRWEPMGSGELLRIEHGRIV